MHSLSPVQRLMIGAVLLVCIILAACSSGGLDEATLLKLTQTAVAATQTAVVNPMPTAQTAPTNIPATAPAAVSTTAQQATAIPETASPAPTTEQPTAVSASACSSDPGSADAFWIYKDATYTRNHFVPSGYMGDIGDVVINTSYKNMPCSGDTSLQVIYTPAGKGPNSCDYAPPCKWSGVYWLEPANNWGKDASLAKAGFDLTGYTRFVFWARAEQKGQVAFKVGGVVAPYGDSLQAPRGFLADLSPDWQQFEIDLKGADLSHIIGGFVFSVSWDQNPDGITFYLDNMRFEK